MTDTPTPMLPCPFCGGKAKLMNTSTAEMSTEYSVRCSVCHATTPKSYHAWGYGSEEAEKRWTDAKAEAIAAWNTRPQSQGSDEAVIEALDKIERTTQEIQTQRIAQEALAQLKGLNHV